MRKAVIFICLVGALACNKLKKDAAEADGAAPLATGSGALPTGIVSKALSLVSGGPFQGEIDQKMVSEGKTMPMASFVKGDKTRVDMETDGKKMSMIMDTTAKQQIMLDHQGKTAMIMPITDVSGGGTPGTPGTPTTPKAPPEVTKTGKSDVVAGYSCDIWNIKSADKPDEDAEACVAAGVNYPGLGSKGGSGWDNAFANGAGYPLRLVMRKGGVEKGRVEVTKIERGNVDDSKFQIPPDYKKMDMSQMMRGLGGMGGPKK